MGRPRKVQANKTSITISVTDNAELDISTSVDKNSLDKIGELLGLLAVGDIFKLVMHDVTEQIGPESSVELIAMLEDFISERNGDNEPVIQPINAIASLLTLYQPYGEEK